MIVRPMFRGVLCGTAHPDGCQARVDGYADAVADRPRLAVPRRVLVVGASGGIGLAVRSVAAFAGGAATIGVCRGRPGRDGRTANAGWYNTAAFERRADREGVPAWTVLGDAFDDEVKRRTAELVRGVLGGVDLVVYSVAAARRAVPGGRSPQSVIKTLAGPHSDKAYDVSSGRVVVATIEPATSAEVADTVAVMGGEDWAAWVDALARAGALAPGAGTLAFSYVGAGRTVPIYRGGTLGQAKDHLEATGRTLDAALRPLGGFAAVAVMPASVTQSAAAIPLSALYTMLLMRVAREAGVREALVDQAYRLFAEHLDGATPDGVAGPGDGAGQADRWVDDAGRLRLDGWELRPDIQDEVERRWRRVSTDRLPDLADEAAFLTELRQVYGFAFPDVDYDADVNPVRPIPSLAEFPAGGTSRREAFAGRTGEVA